MAAHKLVNLFILIVVFNIAIAFDNSIMAADGKKPLKLSLSEFIQRASSNDTVFERILIDRLTLQYRHAVLMPPSDVIIDVKSRFNLYLNQNRANPEATLSLTKLFPYNGTEVSLSFNKSTSTNSQLDNSDLQFVVSQAIARNAFGKGTQLLDKIIGIEIQIVRYQIIEAYEDYLAVLTAVYYDWYSAYENLKVGRSSLKANKRLMENILERQRQKIALPIDVNKMQLLLIGKNENIVTLQEVYNSVSNLIFKAVRHKESTRYIPVMPDRPTLIVRFDEDYKAFTQTSRTYMALHLLEQQGTLEVKKAADDLLPSTKVLVGLKYENGRASMDNSESVLFAGISLSWPVQRTVDKANFQLAQIEYTKTTLSNQNKYEDLRTSLNNLYLQINREQQLIKTSKEKIILAQAILKDEAENYSFGKVTLNDYIDAVNRVDEINFGHTEHTVQLNKLLIDWLRLTDKLVDEKVLD